MEKQKLNNLVLVQQVDEIAEKLLQLKNQLPTFGLSNGKSGIALFYCYYATFKNDNAYLSVADDILAECFENISSKNYTGHNYFRELAEFGIFLEFAQKNQWIESEIEPFLSSIDVHLYGYMQKKLAQNNLDVYAGALLSGEYFLNRNSSSEIAQKALKELVYSIDKIKDINEQGDYYWKSPIFNDDRVYTGITHGSAMIINFLCKVSERNIEEKLCHKLIVGAVNFLKQHQGNDDSKALFPNMIGEKSGDIQLSFCYGDLGTSYSLWKAAKLLNDKDSESEIIQILHRLGQLDSAKFGQILDAEITYGAAGVATIFDKIARLNNDILFESYANHWYQKIPQFATYQNEMLGYRAIFNQYSPATNIGFGEGIAGIGIGLMRYLNKKMPPIYELIGL